MWSIVCFEVDNSVDYFPDFWIRKGYCAWPKKHSSVCSFMEKRIDLATAPNEFTMYKACVLHNNISDINVAREKARKAESTSDLSSYTDTDDPKSSVFKTKINETPTIPVLNDSGEFEEYEDPEIVEVYNPIQDTPSVFDYFVSTPKRDSDVSNYISKASNNKKTKCNTSSLPASLVVSENTLEKQLKDFQKSVNRHLIIQKHKVKNVQDRLDILISMQAKMYEKLCDHTTAIDTNKYIFENTIKCIDNEDNLNEIEDKLIADIDYKKRVIKQLARLRGQNLSETVRKIMQTLFTDNFLINYSYIGFKGKKHFSSLQICSIIFESIHQLKPFSSVTNGEVEKPLKNWMAQASNRIKKYIEKNTNNLV